MDRLREYQEVERRMRRSEKGERYYRKEKIGSKVREGVIIIPPTPNSILAKEMKKICEEELRGSNISLSVQERGGRRLAWCDSAWQESKDELPKVQLLPVQHRQ